MHWQYYALMYLPFTVLDSHTKPSYIYNDLSVPVLGSYSQLAFVPVLLSRYMYLRVASNSQTLLQVRPCRLKAICLRVASVSRM